MNTNELSPEKSIQIISEMIDKSRKDFEKDSGTPMIIWGAVVTIASIIIWYVLKTTSNPYWNLLWFTIPIVGYPFNYFLYYKKQEKRAKNYLNSAIATIWGCFGIIATLIPIIACTLFHEAMMFLTSWITIILGFASALTGLLMKNHWITLSGFVVAIAGGIVSVFLDNSNIPLLMGGAALITLLIPGIILNLKKK